MTQSTYTAADAIASRELKDRRDHDRKCDEIRSGKDNTITIEDVERLDRLKLPRDYYENLSSNKLESSFSEIKHLANKSPELQEAIEANGRWRSEYKAELEKLEAKGKELRRRDSVARQSIERRNTLTKFIYDNCRDAPFLAMKSESIELPSRIAALDETLNRLREEKDDYHSAAHWGRDKWMSSNQSLTKEEVAERQRSFLAMDKPIALAQLEKDATQERALRVNDAIQHYIYYREEIKIPTVEQLKPVIVKRWIDIHQKTLEEQTVALAERAEQVSRIKRGEQLSDDSRAHIEIANGIAEMHNKLVDKIAATNAKLKLHREILAELGEDVAITETASTEPIKTRAASKQQMSLPRVADDNLDL